MNARRLSAIAVVLAVGGAVALDVVSPAASPAPSAAPIERTGGVLACPFAVEPGARALVHLANVGETTGTARVTVPRVKAKPFVTTLSLEPGSARSVRLDGRVKGAASAIVDHDGGAIVASHSLWFPRATRPGARAGGAAAMCGRPLTSQTVVVAHLRTLDAESYLTLTNPGSALVRVASVSLIVGREIVRPTVLQDGSIVVRARSRRTIRIGDYVFDAREVTAVITMGTGGRVVAEGLVATRGGSSLVGAQSPAEEVAVISGRSGAYATVGVAAAGTQDAGLRPRIISASDQSRAQGFPQSIAPDRNVVAQIPLRSAGGAAGYAIEATAGGVLSAGTSWAVIGRDDADIAAAEAAGLARRWAAVFGSPVRDARSEVVLMNPGGTAAEVTLIRTGGSPRQLTLEPGRLAVVGLAGGLRTAAVSVVSSEPIAVAVVARAASARVASRPRITYGFGLAAAVLDPLPGVAVVEDPRAGVPA